MTQSAVVSKQPHPCQDHTDYSTYSSNSMQYSDLSPPVPGYYIKPPQKIKESSSYMGLTYTYSHIKSNSPRPWKTELCRCGDDVGTFCSVLACLPFIECWLSKKMGEGFCMPWCVPIPASLLRLKIRTKYNIEGSILGDVCTSLWCRPCVLCQLKKEVDYLETVNKKDPEAKKQTTHDTRDWL